MLPVVDHLGWGRTAQYSMLPLVDNLGHGRDCMLSMLPVVGHLDRGRHCMLYPFTTNIRGGYRTFKRGAGVS